MPENYKSIQVLRDYSYMILNSEQFKLNSFEGGRDRAGNFWFKGTDACCSCTFTASVGFLCPGHVSAQRSYPSTYLHMAFHCFRRAAAFEGFCVFGGVTVCN